MIDSIGFNQPFWFANDNTSTMVELFCAPLHFMDKFLTVPTWTVSLVYQACGRKSRIMEEVQV